MQGLLYKLKQTPVPDGRSNTITLDMDPPVYNKFVDIGMTPENVESTTEHLMEKTYQVGYAGKPDPVAIIESRIAKAMRDSNKSFNAVQDLEPIAVQHGWLQVTDLQQRDTICAHIASLLCSAYTRTHKPEKAAALLTSIENEKNCSGTAGRSLGGKRPEGIV